MRSKLIFIAFGMLINAIIQLLLYYINPNNWAAIVSALKVPQVIIINLIIIIAAALAIVCALMMAKKEDERDHTQQTKTLKLAVREALKEDREELTKQQSNLQKQNQREHRSR